jgi:hypothetical protein
MSPEGMSLVAQGAPLLPETLVLEVTWRSEVSQRLAPMPTTSLHGALGHAIRAAACHAPCRASCHGCRHRPDCSYAILFEPVGTHDHGEGVHDRAPPPLVLRPVDMSPASTFHEVPAGGLHRARVCLIGGALRCCGAASCAGPTRCRAATARGPWSWRTAPRLVLGPSELPNSRASACVATRAAKASACNGRR